MCESSPTLTPPGNRIRARHLAISHPVTTAPAMQAPVAPLFEVRGWFEFVGAVAAASGTVLTALWFILKPRLEQFVVDTHRTRAADIKVIEAESWAKEIGSQEAVYHLAQRTAADLTTHSQSFENLKREVHHVLPMITTLPTVLSDLSHNIHEQKMSTQALNASVIEQRLSNDKINATLIELRDGLGEHRTELAVMRVQLEHLTPRHP